ncbi:protein of unknown function [Candidatus Nitrosotalea okcheonensis]|uniref:Uncharacterized protein n=1 Tax=Candidatus Nitrosotalea okcheonensis TaxID=1903276 RepID=A0A2H1FC75_9ARCH|nr:protein of unknown function [Candidatus Nitrosotalea okcheonensis]
MRSVVAGPAKTGPVKIDVAGPVGSKTIMSVIIIPRSYTQDKDLFFSFSKI